MNSLVFINRFFAPDHSATSQLLSDLAFALARQGADVKVITSRQLYDNPSIQLDPEEIIQGVHVTRIATSQFGRDGLLGRAVDYATFYLSATRLLLNRLRPGDVVIAKTDPPLLSLCAGFAARKRGATLVNWIQDLFPEVATALDLRPVRVAEPLLRRLRNRSLQQAACNVVLGYRMKDRLLQAHIEADQIAVIPNWADGQQIRPIRAEDNPLRTEWELTDRFVVGYSGNMGRAHDFKTLIDAAALLRSNPRIVFLLIGSGAHKAWLEGEIHRRELSNVLLKPYQPRPLLAQSLGAPNVHLVSLQPSLEGLIVPSKFYGVAAAGRPTIFLGDSSGEIPRILQQEHCGLCVGIGDGHKLARVIADLSTQPNTVERMGMAARRLFERQFDKPIAVTQWEQLLRTHGPACWKDSPCPSLASAAS